MWGWGGASEGVPALPGLLFHRVFLVFGVEWRCGGHERPQQSASGVLSWAALPPASGLNMDSCRCVTSSAVL